MEKGQGVFLNSTADLNTKLNITCQIDGRGKGYREQFRYGSAADRENAMRAFCGKCVLGCIGTLTKTPKTLDYIRDEMPDLSYELGLDTTEVK